jgi:hypothetical protein
MIRILVLHLLVMINLDDDSYNFPWFTSFFLFLSVKLQVDNEWEGLVINDPSTNSFSLIKRTSDVRIWYVVNWYWPHTADIFKTTLSTTYNYVYVPSLDKS